MRDDFSRIPKTGEGKAGVSVHTSALARAWRRAAVAISATALVGSVAIASIVTPSSASAQANPPSAAGAPTPIKPAKLTNSKATLAPGERMLLTWIGVNRPSGSDQAPSSPSVHLTTSSLHGCSCPPASNRRHSQALDGRRVLAWCRYPKASCPARTSGGCSEHSECSKSARSTGGQSSPSPNRSEERKAVPTSHLDEV